MLIGEFGGEREWFSFEGKIKRNEVEEIFATLGGATASRESEKFEGD